METASVITAQQILLEQIDLEIALKTRIAQLVQARIDYAFAIRNVIVEGEADPTRFAEDAAQRVAVEAYQHVEELSRPLLPDPADVKTLLLPQVETPPTPRVTVKRRTTGRASKGGPKYRPPVQTLYVQSHFMNPPLVAKLSCTDCRRADFPSVQGLLNHCRISHQREFTGHAELVEVCGEPLSMQEGRRLIEEGVDIKAVNLPSLRTLFERAVVEDGGAGGSLLSETAKVQSPSSNFLSKTLGLHKDSPSLAPFLGTQNQRKAIHAVNDDSAVEVLSVDTSFTTLSENRCHRLARGVFNCHAHPYQMNGESEASEGMSASLEVTETQRQSLWQSDSSRFHVRRRIVLADHSVWIPPQARHTEHLSLSHRWSLSVSAPSYSANISTFLRSVEVTCMTQPPVFLEAKCSTGPPFICFGTTDRPFLARVRLQWAGDTNPPLELDHWVEITATKNHTPVLGEEHIQDIELDRDTQALPLRTSGDPMSAWKVLLQHPRLSYPGNEAQPEPTLQPEASQPVAVDLDIPSMLSIILKDFPITAEDTKKRHPPRLPYPLMRTMEDFQALPVGRRKAIEWGRAIAIMDAYRKHIYPERPTAEVSVGFVFRWLQQKTRVIVPPTFSGVDVVVSQVATSMPQVVVPHTSSGVDGVVFQVATSMIYCASCGVDVCAHRPELSLDGIANGYVCGAPLVRLPLVDAKWWTQRHWYKRDSLTPSIIASRVDDELLTSSCEPSLLAAILRWRHSGTAQREDIDRMTAESSCVDVYQALAPAALLGIVAELYLTKVTQLATSVLLEQRAYNAHIYGGQAMCLAPSHVIRGVLKGAFRGGVNEAIFTSRARIGTTEVMDS